MQSWTITELSALWSLTCSLSILLAEVSMNFLVTESDTFVCHCNSQSMLILFLNFILIDDLRVAKCSRWIFDEIDEDHECSRQSVVFLITMFIISFSETFIWVEIQWIYILMSRHWSWFTCCVIQRSIYCSDCILDFVDEMIAAWLFMKMISDVLCWMYCSTMLKVRTNSCNLIAYIMTVLFSSTSRFLFTLRFKTTMIAFTLFLMILSFVYITSWLESLMISSCSFNAVFLLSAILNSNEILQKEVIIEYMHFIEFSVSKYTWSYALYLLLSFLKKLQNLKFLSVNIMYCFTFFIWLYI